MKSGYSVHRAVREPVNTRQDTEPFRETGRSRRVSRRTPPVAEGGVVMKGVLRMSAGVILLATLAVWVFTGAHTGWTRTSTVVMKIDPVTELEYPESEPTFVAGVEVLGGGLGLSLLLAGGSFLFRYQPTSKQRKASL